MKTNILTKNIILSVNEKDKDRLNEIYTYLRAAIKAQNQAFNHLMFATGNAINKNLSNETINNIYYSYSHQTPDVSMESEKFLYEVLNIAPITETIIEEKINELAEFLKSKGKSEKSIKKSCDDKRKKYNKYIGISKDEIQKKIDRLENYCAYPQHIYENFANGLSTPAYVTQQVREYWKSHKTNFVLGNENPQCIGLNNPLILPPNIFYNKNGELIGITHDYETDNEFFENVHKERNLKVNFNMPYKKGEDKISFRLILGNIHSSNELRCVIENIFLGIVKIRGSKLGFQKDRKTGKDTTLCLHLSIEQEAREHYLDKAIRLGVDLGQKNPAVCALNNNPYERAYIGDGDTFLSVRGQMQNRYRRLQKQLSMAKSGHGRSKKLKALETLESKERNFAKTYNDMISKRVIDFALKHNAGVINLEYLKGYDTSKFILRNWSYYQLQMMIEQKAAKEGIEVRYINPCYTSQVCSICGNYSEGQRKTQSDFICNNGCNKSKDGKRNKINADFNAARNISKSTLYLDKSADYKIENLIKEAKEYYGIE